MGTRVERVEDPTFLTAGGTYVADLHDPRLDGRGRRRLRALDRGPRPDRSVDTSDAVDAPGVLAVFTAADSTWRRWRRASRC